MWYVVIIVKLHSLLCIVTFVISICNDCDAKHVSELSKPHEIVPFKERGSTPICQKHYCKIIDLYCTDCDIPLCVQCASSKEHQHHKTIKGKRGRLKLDLQELEKYIYILNINKLKAT